MRLLIAGNSQALCLKDAIDANPNVIPVGWEVSFVVTPGGNGPYLALDGERLVETRKHPDHPMRSSPSGAFEDPIGVYDAVLVSALGYIDGGFRFHNPFMEQGALYRFGPTGTLPLISEGCYQETLRGLLLSQPGFRFLTNLRKIFKGRIFAQPFPLLSEAIIDHPDWRLKRHAADPVGMYRFLSSTAMKCLGKVCAEANATMLALPEGELAGFSPRDQLGPDHVHPKSAFGLNMMRQLFDALALPETTRA